MTDNNKSKFKEGFITYTVTHELPSDFSFNCWDDGYVAFSKGEERLKDIEAIKDKSLTEVVKNKVDGINGVAGFLMEVNLWRKRNGIVEKVDETYYEEISIERDDRDFLVQKWKLETKSKKDPNCYWRKVDTLPRDNSIFKGLQLKSIEVVYPENRLHFFLTIGGDKNGNRQG